MSFSIERSVALLERTPGVLRAWLEGLDEFWARGDYGEGTFSPFDVVGHLIEAERCNWMTRARWLVERGESQPFPPFDRFGMYEASRGKAMAALLDEFDAARRRSLDELAALDPSPERLASKGRHPEFGAVTLEQLLATWVVHDLGHLRQVAVGMAFQYNEAVGPWRAYLSVLAKS